MFIFIKRFIMITIEGDNRFGPYHRNTESECKVDLSSPLNTHIHIYMNRILGNLVSYFSVHTAHTIPGVQNESWLFII